MVIGEHDVNQHAFLKQCMKAISRVGIFVEELLPGNVVPRIAYLIRFAGFRGGLGRPGFSIVIATRNRKAFLARAVEAVLHTASQPFEILIMDNGSKDGTHELCDELAARHPGVVRSFRLGRNFGTNAYALGFLAARFDFLVDMDDDILALSAGWDTAVTQAFQHVPNLGFLSLNVIQDEFTNGAKPAASAYREEIHGGTAILRGPAGGWFAITRRDIYRRAGGFVFRPYKPFQMEDAKYVNRVTRRGLRSGLLRDAYAYHACGPFWNSAFGYHGMWKEKYGRDYGKLRDAIDTIKAAAPPPERYPWDMVGKFMEQE